MALTRKDGRLPNKMRKIRIIRGYIKHAEGSALIEMGDTRVLCTASVEDRVPLFLKGSGQGWVTAEYSMLPRSTHVRTMRESSRGGPSGRSQEIQRLIGRSLRAVVDLEALAERTIWIDCDVIQADGGTRTTSVTGSFIALVDAVEYLKKTGVIKKNPIKDFLAAVSVGVYRGVPVLDLTYLEDSEAAVDMNVVMTGQGGFVEIQGTAERGSFGRDSLDELLSLAEKGITELIEFQRRIVGDII